MSRPPPTVLAPDGSVPDDVARERRLALHLPGLGCRACARRAEHVIRRVPGVLAATVRLFRERADVRFDARHTSAEALAAAVGRAGFTVAGMERDPAGDALGVDLGVGLAALANLLFLDRAGSGNGLVGVARLALAAVALAVTGGPPARRAVGLLRRGALDRDVLAGAAVVVCFAAGVLELLLGGGGREPPAFLASLGASAAAWADQRGAGFVAAAGIAVGARLARAAEVALYRRALRDVQAREARARATVRRLDGSGQPHPAASRELVAGDRLLLLEGEEAPADLQLEAPARVALARAPGHLVAEARLAGDVVPVGAVLLSGEVVGRVLAARRDRAAALDAEVRASLARLAASRAQPAPDTWEDAAVRGIVTAALGCASFALVTHGWLGAGPLAPAAIFAMAAVLAGVSPAAILVAAPAARAVAVLRARAIGVVVRNAAALEGLARVDTVCFEPGGSAARGAGLQGLRARGVRALVLDGDHPAARAASIRDLQLAGARVVLVGDGRDDAAALAQADVAVTVAPGSAAPIVLTEGRVDDLAGLVDLGRALRAARWQSAALGTACNVALIPAAALGWITPLRAAALVLLETLLGLAFAARLLYRPRLGPTPAAGRSAG